MDLLGVLFHRNLGMRFVVLSTEGGAAVLTQQALLLRQCMQRKHAGACTWALQRGVLRTGLLPVLDYHTPAEGQNSSESRAERRKVNSVCLAGQSGEDWAGLGEVEGWRVLGSAARWRQSLAQAAVQMWIANWGAAAFSTVSGNARGMLLLNFYAKAEHRGNATHAPTTPTTKPGRGQPRGTGGAAGVQPGGSTSNQGDSDGARTKEVVR
jgi:hypothetical protein